MLAQFSTTFQVTAQLSAQPCLELVVTELRELVSLYGGKTFNHGLYRILHSDQLDEAKASMQRVFPELGMRIEPFAVDWLGRYFALDHGRIVKGAAQILMLEVGAGEAMQIPTALDEFHNVELVEYSDDALSVQFWNRWRALHPSDLPYSQCVGYKVPLFLGGADELENLEVIDLNVYAEICGQLRNKARHLSPGQTIRSVSFDA
jgi:hypothetical protein